MDDAIGFFAIAAGLLIFAVPIFALVLAFRARERARRAEEKLQALEARVAYIEWWGGALNARFQRDRASSEARPEPARAEPHQERAPLSPETAPTPAAVPTPDANVVPAAPAAEAAQPELPAPPPIEAQPGSPPVIQPEPPSPAPVVPPIPPLPATRGDFEGLVGVRLFAWLGGAVLFIAAALFLQYSIEHDLIPPSTRVAIGLLAGTAFIFLGEMMRRRADRAGQALAGAGLATLYASLYAARALYGLLPAPVTFGAMALVTALAGALALRREAYVLAVIGLLGGFATPILLSTGENRPIALFAYIAMLDVTVAIVAYRRGWHSLLLLAAAGSLLLYAGWGVKFLDDTLSAVSLFAAAVLGATFAIPALLAKETGPGPSSSGSSGSSTVRRVAVAFGAVAPFFAALAVASSDTLEVGPALLVPYLLLLSIGTLLASARMQLRWLMLAGPVFTILVMAIRADEELFPAHRALALVWFSLPVALTRLAASPTLNRFIPRSWFGDAKAAGNWLEGARLAAGIGACGAPLLIARIVDIEPHAEPAAPLAAFVAFHLLSLVTLSAEARTGRWLVAADAVSAMTLVVVSPRYELARSIEFIGLAVVPLLLLWGFSLALARSGRTSRTGWLASALALPAHFPFLYWWARGKWPSAAIAVCSLGCAALALISLRLFLTSFSAAPTGAATSITEGSASSGPSLRERDAVIATIGAITLAFVTAAVPIALENQWITVAWAAEAAALAWLRRKVPHEGLVVGAAALAAATFIRLVANPWLWEYETSGGTIVVNWLLYTFGVPIVSFFAAAGWLRVSPFAQRLRLPAALHAGAGVLAFMMMNAEIADAFTGGAPGGWRWSGRSVLEDMIYSLGWGLFGLVTLVVGIMRKSRGARASALGVLVLTFAKVFLHDLWQLGSLYRVGSLIGLAVALLAVSFLMQRFVLRSSIERDGPLHPEGR